jgi:hypothetical protein
VKKCGKHESIKKLLGLIQWLERQKKIQKKSNPDTAFTGSASGFKFIHNNLQTRVHQLAVALNPVAQEREKKFK